MANAVTEQTFEDEVLKSEKPVIVVRPLRLNEYSSRF